MTVDIATAEGQVLIREFAKSSDVFIENFKVGDLKRYGLDYASLSDINSGLVYCSITGYGQDGPYANKPGYDFVFQAIGGLMSITARRTTCPAAGRRRQESPSRMSLPECTRRSPYWLHSTIVMCQVRANISTWRCSIA